MTEEQLIKSKKRVQQHGEVFTPKKIVNLMLDQEELQENLRDLSSTFLEPSDTVLPTATIELRETDCSPFSVSR